MRQTVEAVRKGQGLEGAVRAPPRARVPREMGALPWDYAHAEIGMATTDFLVLVVKVVLLYVQDQIEVQVADSR